MGKLKKLWSLVRMLVCAYRLSRYMRAILNRHSLYLITTREDAISRVDIG
jgi:hypothetical protein